jgi:cell division protein FtsB
LRRAIIGVTVVVLIDAVFGDRGLAEMRKAQRAYVEAHGSLGQLKRANTELRAHARLLAGDTATIEDVAREELGLVREGEVLFVVKPAR